MNDVYLSLIIPCYNEGKKLEGSIKAIHEYMNSYNSKCRYEIIVVNDGSNDNETLPLCKTIQEKYENTRVITYEENKGKGYAVRRGITFSKGKYVIFMDADLSTDLSAIKETLKKLETTDVVIGSRRHKNSNLVKKQGVLRRFIGKSCSLITNLIVPLHLKDTQCGFKGFNGDLARKIAGYQTLDGFSFDVEMLYIAKLNNLSIEEIPVIWENDNDSKVKVLDSSFKFFIDLFKIRARKSNYKFIEVSPLPL